jgi:nicotinamide-nucleotide amidase
MGKGPNVCILTVGNEVLDGSTVDTNSSWICRQIAGRGGRVLRVSILPDERAAIASQILHDVALGPNLLITIGGLGPTQDDLTLFAVADSANTDLQLSETALEMVQKRYDELEAEGRVTQATSEESKVAREKMARIPTGSTPLFNPVGAAPGVVAHVSGVPILSLPGVPSEMKGIVRGSAVSTLHEFLGMGVFRSRSLTTSTNDESVLAAPLAVVTNELDKRGVYVKSRSLRFAEGLKMIVTISKGGEDVVSVDDDLDVVQTAIARSLGEAGVEVLNVESNE